MRLIILSVLIISLSACSSNSDTEKIEELQRQIAELEEKLEAIPEKTITNSKDNSQDVNESKSDNKNQKSSYKFPTWEDLEKGKKINVDILNVKSKTDRYFNNYHVLTLKNNYPKKITSVRIGTKQWIQRTPASSKERLLTETVIINIPPNEQGEIIIRNDKWGGSEVQVLSHVLIEVDAVTFSDGTADESLPPIGNF